MKTMARKGTPMNLLHLYGPNLPLPFCTNFSADFRRVSQDKVCSVKKRNCKFRDDTCDSMSKDFSKNHWLGFDKWARDSQIKALLAAKVHQKLILGSSTFE